MKEVAAEWGSTGVIRPELGKAESGVEEIVINPKEVELTPIKTNNTPFE